MNKLFDPALHWPQSVANQRGVGILEVLIALVVISLGVLGMAGLQLTGMKHSTNGFNRAKAVMISENMATRMRINRTGVASAQYNGFDSSAVSCATRPDPYCETYKDANAQRCDAAQLAAFDRFAVACGSWGSEGARGGVADLLPSGAKVEVDCDDNPCGATSSYTLSVSWQEGRNASAEEEQQTSRVQMRLRP